MTKWVRPHHLSLHISFLFELVCLCNLFNQYCIFVQYYADTSYPGFGLILQYIFKYRSFTSTCPDKSNTYVQLSNFYRCIVLLLLFHSHHVVQWQKEKRLITSCFYNLDDIISEVIRRYHLWGDVDCVGV